MGFLAFVFPGQGAQSPGMGRELYEQSPAAQAVFDRAEAMLPGLLATCFSGPMDKLTRTEWAQPAIFTTSLACAAAANEAGLKPAAAAGFSLGEWTAITAAGMLGFDKAFDLVRRRGEWMARCAKDKPGGMAAVLRVPADELETLLKQHEGVWAVNYNAPDQTVVAGLQEALDDFLGALNQAGKRFMKLNVAGAFHSPLMVQASQRLSAALADETLNEPAFPVYSNLTALPYALDQASDTLARQASHSVQWISSVENMAAAKIDTFLELGPGRVLGGLIRKILPAATVLQAEDLAGIQAAAAQIGERQ